MVVKKGETGTYVKWLQQGLHITMIIGCSSRPFQVLCKR